MNHRLGNKVVVFNAENLFDEVHQLQTDASCADNELDRLRIINIAIGKATRLVEGKPESADAHHLLAVCWYDLPSATPDRSQQVKYHLTVALGLDPDHQFASQYLGYINFDEGRFAEALACFERTDFGYFESLDQNWRALKARELMVVCRLRLRPKTLDLGELLAFIAAYRDQFYRDESNTVWPLELRQCAEWLYDQGVPADSPVISTILRFFNEIDYLKAVRNQGLVAAWGKGSPT